MKDQDKVLTSDEVRQLFEAEGITIKEWAVARGYLPATVYAVLNGNMRTRYGLGHRFAVDLGLKPMPKGDLLSGRSLQSPRQEGEAA